MIRKTGRPPLANLRGVGVVVTDPAGHPLVTPYGDFLGTVGGMALGNGYWSELTNGDPITSELIFDSFGDTIDLFVPV